MHGKLPTHIANKPKLGEARFFRESPKLVMGNLARAVVKEHRWRQLEVWERGMQIDKTQTLDSRDEVASRREIFNSTKM